MILPAVIVLSYTYTLANQGKRHASPTADLGGWIVKGFAMALSG
jgi:hypothetical protein